MRQKTTNVKSATHEDYLRVIGVLDKKKVENHSFLKAENKDRWRQVDDGHIFHASKNVIQLKLGAYVDKEDFDC